MIDPRRPLTQRHAEVLDLLCDEKSTAEIADALSLSTHTVGHHVQALLAGYGVKDRAALVARVLRRQRDQARDQLATCERALAVLDRRGRGGGE